MRMKSAKEIRSKADFPQTPPSAFKSLSAQPPATLQKQSSPCATDVSRGSILVTHADIETAFSLPAPDLGAGAPAGSPPADDSQTRVSPGKGVVQFKDCPPSVLGAMGARKQRFHFFTDSGKPHASALKGEHHRSPPAPMQRRSLPAAGPSGSSGGGGGRHELRQPTAGALTATTAPDTSRHHRLWKKSGSSDKLFIANALIRFSQRQQLRPPARRGSQELVEAAAGPSAAAAAAAQAISSPPHGDVLGGLVIPQGRHRSQQQQQQQQQHWPERRPRHAEDGSSRSSSSGHLAWPPAPQPAGTHSAPARHLHLPGSVTSGYHDFDHESDTHASAPAAVVRSATRAVPPVERAVLPPPQQQQLGSPSSGALCDGHTSPSEASSTSRRGRPPALARLHSIDSATSGAATPPRQGGPPEPSLLRPSFAKSSVSQFDDFPMSQRLSD